MTELETNLPPSEIIKQRAIDAHELALMLLAKAGEMNLITVLEHSENVDGNTYGNTVKTKIELVKRKDGFIEVVSSHSTGNQEGETFNETQKVVYQTKLGVQGLVRSIKTENGVLIEEVRPGQVVDNPESDIVTHLNALRQNLSDAVKEKMRIFDGREDERRKMEGGETRGTSAPRGFQGPFSLS